MADVVGQFGRGEPIGEGPEQAAGVDLRQLVIITYKDQLPCCLFDEVGDSGELTGAHH